MKWKPFFIVIIIMLIIGGCNKPKSGVPEGEPARTKIITEVKSEGVPVEVIIVKRKKVEQSIPLTGVLNPLSAVDIVAEVTGKVVSIEKTLGSPVTKADTLAKIDDRIAAANYLQAASQVLSADNSLKIAKLNSQSDEELFKAGDISELARENSRLSYKTAEAGVLSARAAANLQKKTYEDTRIMSPINGYVSRKFITEGTMVNPGMVLYRVVDLEYMKIEVGVPQKLISLVRKGGDARLVVSALNNKVMSGRVKYISPQANENTGAFAVEIHVKNTSAHDLLAGMTVKIKLLLRDNERRLVIPAYALVVKNDSTFVYRIEDKLAVLTPVTSHKTMGGAVIIEQGIREGDRIVTVGMKNLGLKTPIILEQVN